MNAHAIGQLVLAEVSETAEVADPVRSFGHGWAVSGAPPDLSSAEPDNTRGMLPRMPEAIADRLFLKLKSEREHQDLTVQWVADRVGVTKQSISEWELGKSRPSLSAVRKWVKALKLGEAVVDEWIEEQAVQRVKAILTDKGRLGHDVRQADVDALLVIVRNTLRANRG